ncbi:MAG: hypothetical protein ABSA12_06740 [Verrucomicrobiia bacterium]|jgi:hypothetical protein
MENDQSDDFGEIFSDSPKDYKFPPPEMTWKSPCYVELAIPISCPLFSTSDGGSAWQNVAFAFPVDILARRKAEDQLSEMSHEAFQLIRGPFEKEWAKIIFGQYDLLKQKLVDIPTLFRPPLKYVRRCEFSEVGLSTALRMQPDSMDVYVAREGGQYPSRRHLRVHSSLKMPQKGFVWFDQRIPERLGDEEICLWFEALVSRLPKRSRPLNVESWVVKLAEYDDSLVRQEARRGEEWLERSKIAVVFGPEDEPAKSHVEDFYRDEITAFRLGANVLEFFAEQEFDFPSGKKRVPSRVVVLCKDAGAARATQLSMEDATKVYFGLSKDICGIILEWKGQVYSIGVGEATIRRYCCPKGERLLLPSPPGQKFRSHVILGKLKPPSGS